MGKTTLIRTMLGLVRPTSGAIRIRGTDCTRARPDRIARLGIGYVPEGRAIFANLTVRENLLMAARAGINGRDDWSLDRVMQTFPRLAERLQHGGAQLSGGEQQMLAIGRALMTNPEVMLFDEATEGLAPLVVREIWRIIGAIRADGHRIVDRRSELSSGPAHTDRCVVLEKGRVVLEGRSAGLAQAPENWRDTLVYRKRSRAGSSDGPSSQTTQAGRSSATPPMTALVRPSQTDLPATGEWRS